MAAKLSSFGIFLIIVFSVFSGADVQGNVPPSNSPSLARLRLDLDQQSKLIAQLKNHTKELEQSLGLQNKKFVILQKHKKELESELYLVITAQKSLGEKIISQRHDLEKTVKGLVINQLYQKREQNILLENAILKMHFDFNQRLLQQMDSDHQKNQQLIGKMQETLTYFGEQEQQILTNIDQLEQSREQVISEMLAAHNKKELLLGNQDRLKANKYTELRRQENGALDAKMRFAYPVSNFSKLEFQKKGLTFMLSGSVPVVAAQQGKVIFQGPLSTFGNVIVIDHGANLRSVLLGDFGPQVAKGALVQKGELLGFTSSVPNKSGKMYFEVRKDNKIVNTIVLMDSLAGPKNNKL